MRVVSSPKFHGRLKKLRFWGLAADATPSAKASHKYFTRSSVGFRYGVVRATRVGPDQGRYCGPVASRLTSPRSGNEPAPSASGRPSATRYPGDRRRHT